MPQMSPLLWLNLYIYTLIMFLFISLEIYFFFIYIKFYKFEDIKIIKKFFYWLW